MSYVSQAYYALQQLCSPAAWKAAVDGFALKLPTTVRANTASPYVDHVLALLGPCGQLMMAGIDKTANAHPAIHPKPHASWQALRWCRSVRKEDSTASTALRCGSRRTSVL